MTNEISVVRPSTGAVLGAALIGSLFGSGGVWAAAKYLLVDREQAEIRTLQDKQALLKEYATQLAALGNCHVPGSPEAAIWNKLREDLARITGQPVTAPSSLVPPPVVPEAGKRRK